MAEQVTCEDGPLCGQVEHERCAKAVAYQIDDLFSTCASLGRLLGHVPTAVYFVVSVPGRKTDEDEHQRKGSAVRIHHTSL